MPQNLNLLNIRATKPIAPEQFGATQVGNAAAALNEWLGSGLVKMADAGRTYSFSSALTVPDGTVIQGQLNLVWTGAGSVPILSIGDNCEIENLVISTPTTTGNSATIGTGYKGHSIRVTGSGNSGAGFLTIASPLGLDLDLLESTGGFQRAFTIGNDSAWSSGGRVGMLRVRDYTRGVALNYLDGFRLEGYDIQGRNALASNSPGHNGILAAGLRNCLFGPGSIQGAGEHLFRLGGSADRGPSNNNKFGRITMDGPGGSFIKINANAIAYDFQFAGVDAVGRFASVPGGNRELFRLSHCRNFVFGPSRLVVGEGSAYSAQDALALNDVTGVVVQGLHVEGLGQSVVDFASGQDIDETLGNGDVRDITIGSLTGEDLTSRTMVRFSMASGFEASGLHISGVDYFSDGPLFAANGATVVDGPCSISGRFRKTDLTTLPSTTNLPLNMALDLEIGQRRVKNLGGVLAWADLTTPYDFGAVGNGVADDTVALQAWAAAIQGRTGYLPPDSHFRATQELLLTVDGTSIVGEGTLEQLTWGFSGFQIFADNVTIDGPKIISTQTKTMLSESLGSRFLGDVARGRCCSVYNAGDNNTIKIISRGFVASVNNAGRRVWRPSVTLSGGTTTTIVLNAADAATAGSYVGGVIRVLGGPDTGLRRITAYDHVTNTVTVDAAWSSNQNGTGRSYVIILGRQINTVLNIVQYNVDFGVLAGWVDGLLIERLFTFYGEQTQQEAAPPHSLYVTGDSNYMRSRNVTLRDNYTLESYGSAYKFRGVDGLITDVLHAERCRDIASIEQCSNVVCAGGVGADIGGSTDGSPTGFLIVGGLDVHVGDVSTHFSASYVPGVAVLDYDPIGVKVGSALDGSGPYTIPTNVTLGKISARWETEDNNGLALYGLQVERSTDATVDPAVLRVRCAAVSAVASFAVTAVRFISAKDSEVLDAFALSMTGAITTVARFDANAVNCRVYFDSLQNASMTIVNNGTGCFTHQPGELATALAGALTPTQISPQGQLTGTGSGGAIAVQGTAATWALRGDAFQTLTMARLRASGVGVNTLWYGWSSADSATGWLAINPDTTPRIRTGNGLIVQDPSAVSLLNIKSNGAVVFMAVAVASLPAAASNTYGRMFVTDSTVAASGNFGAIVAGGGANRVPVWSDGTNWRIG